VGCNASKRRKKKKCESIEKKRHDEEKIQNFKCYSRWCIWLPPGFKQFCKIIKFYLSYRNSGQIKKDRVSKFTQIYPKIFKLCPRHSAMWRDVRLEIRYRGHGLTHRSCLEGSITPRRIMKYQPTPRNAPEERRPQLYRDTSL
jgi:hypothetical protein